MYFGPLLSDIRGLLIWRIQGKQSEMQGEEERKQQYEDQNSLDTEYDLNDFKMDEQLVDTESDKQSPEQILHVKQKRTTQ